MNAEQQQAHLALLGRDQVRIVGVKPGHAETLTMRAVFIPAWRYAVPLELLPDEVGCIGDTVYVIDWSE